MLECTGMRCPQPVIVLARAVRDAPDGLVITVRTDDPAALVDIPAWCRMRGHACHALDDDGPVQQHEVTVRRAASR